MKVITFIITVILLLYPVFIFSQNKEHKTYYPNGNVEQTGNYDSEGKSIGEWKFYHENGKLQTTAYYNSNGKPFGEWKFYHANGKLDGILNYTSPTEVTETLFYENGNVYSETHLWLPDTDVAKLMYGNQVERGPFKSYFENGKLNKVGSYNNGNPDGEWKIYDENGILREVYSSFIGMTPLKSQKYDEKGNLIQ
ncbi:toxin-antitoxin system YwqK family antitoxin [Kaistella montana]|uniref:Toxin-antitoxin system YwqK family antitoxin n=1 Tax=Kaistella montana TaxID=1849733 RepID=A0ABW5KBK4_9FLAO|nr:hypothetical protein [Kaistella montana]MCQ4035479.1 hypothetical protein [Kaistella montana]